MPLARPVSDMNQKLFRIGVIGSAITAICCFTPALVLLVTALGLAAIVGYLDYVLFPLLAVFLAMTVASLWAQPRDRGR